MDRLGDTTESLLLVPAPIGGVLWGVGPTVLLPTASSSDLGSGQLGLGPSAAVMMQSRSEPRIRDGPQY